MMLLLAIAYCATIWLVFAKLKLMRLSLPIACVLASVGPVAILSMLFCMQYCHPISSNLVALQKMVPITPQLSQPGRVTEILVRPNEPLKKGQPLFVVDKSAYKNKVDQYTALAAEAEQRVNVAKASIPVTQASLEQAIASRELAKANQVRMTNLGTAVSKQEIDQANTALQVADAEVQQSEASLLQTQLSVKTAIAQQATTATQLANAEYDLEQTTVIAPLDGYVTNLALQPGMLVGSSLGPVMTFVADRDEQTDGVVVATFGQKNFLLIEPGQYSEVVLKDYPGRIFKGRVLTTIDANGAGQLNANGTLPTTLGSKEATRFAVRIKIDDGEKLRIPAGSQGQAVVFTEHVQIAGVPLMLISRMQSWMNFVF